jgi:hypothetical protein
MSKDFLRIKNVPWRVAKKLPKGKPNLILSDRQNDSPDMRELLSLAEKYNGSLGGYITEPDRFDARITFDAITLTRSLVPEELKLKLSKGADQTELIGTNKIYFWWD